MEKDTTNSAVKQYLWRDTTLLSEIPNRKILVCTPYRNRSIGLEELISYYKYIPTYTINWLLIEQDNDKPFNIGSLINIGYLYGKIKEPFYYFFHPLDGRFEYIDLVDNFSIISYTTSKFSNYYGKAFLWKSEIYEELNGIQNLYWGWGTEDDDMMMRAGYLGIPITRINCGEYDLNDNKERIRGINHANIINSNRINKNSFKNGLINTGYVINNIDKIGFLTKIAVNYV